MKTMTIFDDMLQESESIFLDDVPLSYDFIPKNITGRDGEQRIINSCIKPLVLKRNGKNLLIHGKPGIGKTLIVKHIFRTIEEEYDSGQMPDEIVTIYINTWQKNTTYKIIMEICDQLNYKFTHNKKTEDLFKIIQAQLNKKAVVFCFDEIDKVEDLDFLYMILEKIYRKTIILITNYKEWTIKLDERIKSRLTLEYLEFKKYNSVEIKSILQERLRYAFVPRVWHPDAFNLAVRKTTLIGDVRTGLYILKEAGNSAEDRASRKIEIQDVKNAIAKIPDIKIKEPSKLKEDEQLILDIVKNNSGKKIGELFEIYKEKGGEGVYKTFQRRIDFLSKNKFISTDKQLGGKEGTTTIIKYERETKLDEYK